MEGGMMSFLVTGCLDRVVDNAAEKQEALMTNYCEYVHNKFNKYAIGFFFCELLNLVITISQVILICNLMYNEVKLHKLSFRFL